MPKVFITYSLCVLRGDFLFILRLADNWDKLSEYFQYIPAIRKLIYTTNTVEGYYRQIRKVTKKQRRVPVRYSP